MSEKTVPTRRQGVLGVHSLDHFAMTVPSLDEAKRFYGTFGLDVRDEPQGLGVYTFGHPHRWALLREGPHKKLDYLSFGAFADDMPRFAERLKNLSVTMAPPGAKDDAESLWFSENNGLKFQIKAAEKVSAAAKERGSE